MSIIPQKDAQELGFVTTANLGIGATYVSPLLDADGYSQVQTEVNASHDGLMTFEFCSDAAGTDVVRTLNVPYTAANGYQLFAAPAFTNYIRYTFLNNSGSAQTDFYFTTKLLTVPLSPQTLRVDAFLSPAMMSNVSRSVSVGENPQGIYTNEAVDGLAFAAPTPLGAGATYTSPLMDIRKFSQLETHLYSDQQGTLTGRFYADDAKSVLIKTFTKEYNGDEVGDSIYFSGPRFGPYIEYEYVNGATAQTEFLLHLVPRTKSISGEVLGVEDKISVANDVANLGRNILVGKDGDGVYRNIAATRTGNLDVSITDADEGYNATVTPAGSLATSEQTHLVGEAFGDHALLANKYDISLTGSGTQDASGPGELIMSTGTTADSAVLIQTIDVARFIPANYNTTHQAVQIPDGASYATNNIRRWGAFDPINTGTVNGVFFELDSGNWSVCRSLNGTITRVGIGSWTGAGASNFPLNSSNVNVYEITYNAGRAIFKVNGLVMHTLGSPVTPLVNNPDLKAGMSNSNINGNTTDVSMKLRASAIFTFGKGQGVPRPFFQSGTGSAIVKDKAGSLERVVISKTGGGAAAVIAIYDDPATTNNQIGQIAVSTDSTVEIEYDLVFNNGLFIDITGGGTINTTITYE